MLSDLYGPLEESFKQEGEKPNLSAHACPQQYGKHLGRKNTTGVHRCHYLKMKNKSMS